MSARGPAKPKFCSGCHRSFTFSGYESHLKQTTKPACVAVRHAAGSTHAQPSRPSPIGDSPPSTPSSLKDGADPDEDEDPNATSQPVAFEGDYFGTYSADDFNDFDDFDGDNEESILDDEEQRNQEALEEEEDAEVDAANLEDETGWEPHPPQQPASEPADHHQDNDVFMLDGFGGPDRAAQSRAHQHLCSNTFVVPFPGNRAGAPIDRPRERSAYEKYQAHIDSVNTNPYAPFVSAMDWKFARWAKQRGPGSTAVSELLEIDNVSDSYYTRPASLTIIVN